MRTAPIGELTKSVSNWNPSRSPDKAFLYIDLSAVDNVAKAISAATTVIGDEAPSRARQLVAAGDVLVSTVRPNLNAVAVVPPEFDGATASTGFTVLRPADSLDMRYLFQWVRSQAFIAEMVRNATGASYPAVSDRIIKGSMIPAPGLEEQRRIAAILDHADALRTKRRQVVAHLESLVQSIFHDMFGDTDTRYQAIAEFAEVRTGSTPSREDPDNFGGNIPWVKTAEVVGKITHTSEHVSERGVASARLRLFPAGSVVVAMYGQGKTRGQSAILGVDATTNQACAVIIPNEKFDPLFLQTQLAMNYGRLRGIAEGGNQPNLSLGRIQQFSVLLPSLVKQRSFATRVQQVSAQRARMQASSTASDELFVSLQGRAFRG